MSDTRQPPRPDRAGSFAIVTVAYLVAIAVFPITLGAMDAHPLTEVLVADLIATVVIFGFSVWTDNSSMYDAYWSVIPPVIVIALALESVAGMPGLRQALVITGVMVWAIRLTTNWIRGWSGLDHEDWRYVAARSNGKPYWPQSFFAFHLVPTLIVFLACVPAVPAVMTGTADVNALDWIALVVMLAGAGLELVADEQMRGFNATKQAGDICTEGLWAWCRHPNYLGEITFWWGLWLAGVAADPSWWWTVAGPVVMVALFVFASIPMIDQRGIERRPGYEQHMADVPMLLPRPPKARTS